MIGDYSGFRLMWIMVMFDLPVTSKQDRQAATRFRNFLLDDGYQMSQFSVYLRFVGDRSKIPPYVKRVRQFAPENGMVSILFFTDKQLSETITIQKRTLKENPKKPEQLTLF